MPESFDEQFERFKRGERRALAAILTRVENQSPPPAPVAEATGQAERPEPLVVGITGSGGAGKSTLVAASIRHLRAAGQRVAVLACDPQSPLTGGALLGDRVRVQFDPADEGVYFRSLSTRGAQGGIAAATAAALPWLKAFGFDVILIETVGVGQDQVAVRRLVDQLVLLVTPGTGDEVQWEKAGLIEVADLVVVNKADLPGADRVVAQLTSALSLRPDATVPPILRVTATTGVGVPELWQTLLQQRPSAGKSP